MSVQLPCSLTQPPYTEDRTEPVRGSAFARCPCEDCAMQPTTRLRSYNFSKLVKLLAKPNRRGRGARESVRKSHSHLLPPQGGLAVAARKGGYGQDTGSVDPSQAKCEQGIRKQMTKRHQWFAVESSLETAANIYSSTRINISWVSCFATVFAQSISWVY